MWEDWLKIEVKQDLDMVLEVVYLVVRMYFEIGKKLLYVNIGYIMYFEGMIVEESVLLLYFLFVY